jgi:hypothetical protein
MISFMRFEKSGFNFIKFILFHYKVPTLKKNNFHSKDSRLLDRGLFGRGSFGRGSFGRLSFGRGLFGRGWFERGT